MPDDTPKTAAPTVPLQGGLFRKGGQNRFPSQVVERPPDPAPMRRQSTANEQDQFAAQREATREADRRLLTAEAIRYAREQFALEGRALDENEINNAAQLAVVIAITRQDAINRINAAQERALINGAA